MLTPPLSLTLFLHKIEVMMKIKPDNPSNIQSLKPSKCLTNAVILMLNEILPISQQQRAVCDLLPNSLPKLPAHLQPVLPSSALSSL
jgi:hypothetical protein